MMTDTGVLRTSDHQSSHDVDNKSTAEKSLRPVNNKALAALLRESATFVERGEFDPILYTALQDFRAYYKLNYPKRKEKDHAKKKHQQQPKKKVEISTPTDSSFPVETVNPAPTGDSTDGTATTTATSATAQSTSENPVSIEETVTPVTTNPAVENVNGGDYFEQEPNSSERSDVEPTRVETAVPCAPAAGSAPNASSGPVTSTSSHSTGTMSKFHGPIPTSPLFGKFSLPKLHVNIPIPGIPNPAFAATSKKNAQRAKEDLEEFNGALAQQAKASARRKDYRPGDEPGWCDVHFTMGCLCKEPRQDGSNPFATSSTPSIHDTTKPVPAPQSEHATPQEASFATSTAQQHQQANEKQMPGSSDVDNNASNVREPTNEAGIATTISTTNPADSIANAVKDQVATNPFDLSNPFDTTYSDAMQHEHAKPDFQLPTNKNSSLVANGWIEQYRRSKMRLVWKEVLASLVKGRKPGEETTLWIQRETTNVMTGKKELEALHQIPVKLLESVNLFEYSVDNRFSLKVFSANEEFVFRCNTDVASMNWVKVLKQHMQQARENKQPPMEEEKKGPDQPSQATLSGMSSRMTVSELRAICHGAGINTMGMERSELEAAAEVVRKQGTYFAPPPGASHHPIPMPGAPPPPPAAAHTPPPAPKVVPPNADHTTAAPVPQAPSSVPSQPIVTPPQTNIPTAPSSCPPKSELSIKELRAICHGAGINTVGMERGELEAAAESVRKRGTYFEPSPGAKPRPVVPLPDPGVNQEEIRARQELKRQEELKIQEEMKRRKEYEEKQRREAEEARMRAEEFARRKLEEEHRRRVAEEEHRRRLEEQQAAEQRRLAAEQRRRYAEQQAQWEKQQQEEEARRKAAELQAAEQRRRHEEAIRKQQQWHSQNQQRQQQPHNQQQWHAQQQQQWHAQQQQQQWHQQQPQWQQQQHHAYQQHQQARNATPQTHRNPTPPHQQQNNNQQHHHSAASEKYAKMANQTEDNGQAIVTRIKHDILIHWALQPPHLQMLRPIDALVSTIHNVFPPALGVPAHEYFGKWTAISRTDIVDSTGLPDEEKLKKAVRKIRFFLHPDKLPKDLTSEQSFMVKMLWDVTSDAWEEFEKGKEHLDWIK